MGHLVVQTVVRSDRPAHTIALAESLGVVLAPGDTVLLSGPVGAGKSLFCRALIQARQAAVGRALEDVPSPSYTLVQTYDVGPVEIWHADLYRLGDPSEVTELGLDEAMDRAIVLIEWADRLGRAAPARALHLDIAVDPVKPDRRHLTAKAKGPGWAAALGALTQQTCALHDFLADSAWADAQVAPLAGDASARRYFRLKEKQLGSAVVMDAADGDVGPFVEMTDRLRGWGLSAPEILAADPVAGFLLLEDLGDAQFARVAPQDPDIEHQLYACATDLLAHLHGLPRTADGLPPYDQATTLRESRLAVEWYHPAATGETIKAQASDTFDTLIDTACAVVQGPVVCVLRDYHAENLIWLPDRDGLARCGLLDYQDALAGHPAYDLVSLLEDARRDTSDVLRQTMIARYLTARGADPVAFRAAYATFGAQRNLKILGLFTRLWLRDGKPQYLDLLPRVWDHLQRDLRAPHLTDLRNWVADNLPAPTPQILARIKAAK